MTTGRINQVSLPLPRIFFLWSRHVTQIEFLFFCPNHSKNTQPFSLSRKKERRLRVYVWIGKERKKRSVRACHDKRKKEELFFALMRVCDKKSEWMHQNSRQLVTNATSFGVKFQEKKEWKKMAGGEMVVW